ncbi:hypothetical protein CBF37_08385 [Vagococcus vulneris]|uniref:Uncharacterized protein n=2 Tax=Vagococcus vulneris TaxID=1977869 RepID=A0A429ZWZ1_9ENTE|nr:hypothetical protein CBF37_08385 [Vagococcus vulneris]
MLAFFLLFQLKLKQTYQQTNYRKRKKATQQRKKLIEYFSNQQRLTNDFDTQKPNPNVNDNRAIETTFRPRKNANHNVSFFKLKDKMSSIKNKEYLHSKIPLLYQGEMQITLNEAIQDLKAQHYFKSYYGGITNTDLISHFDEYKDRNVFELYDNTFPNAYAKVLFDITTNTNRIGIFINKEFKHHSDDSKNTNSLDEIDEDNDDIMLGFIAVEDSHRANLLLQKYSNIQVIATILGGTYKRVYQNSKGQIRIIKDFINYDLTISLAFYNN